MEQEQEKKDTNMTNVFNINDFYEQLTFYQKQDNSYEFKVFPVLIGFEFNKKLYPTIDEIKLWLRSTDKFGHVLKFDEVIETNTSYQFQINKIYKDPIQAIKASVDNGVTMSIHVTAFKIKKPDLLKQYKEFKHDL